jgi:signal transduction histidine kinase
VNDPSYGTLRIYEVQLGGLNSPILVEGASIAELGAATDSLTLRLMIIAPLLVLAVAALIWLVVGRAMRPVETMRVKASEISASSLDERIEDPETGDELQDLAETLNSLLDRVQSALDRERRLVTDASHEFRSPLAGMRASIEADMRLARTPTPTQYAMLRGIQRLQDLADQLLALNRSERSDHSGCESRLVDLDEIVLSEIERVEGIDGVHIDATGLSGGLVLGNELDFSRIVDNLTVNALRHARSTVAFRLDEDEAHVSLVVADDGPGIPDVQRALVFEPFFRSDEDRGRNDGGPGLGLAIVSELVAKYNGRIGLEQDEELGGARFQVVFPSARAGATA